MDVSTIISRVRNQVEDVNGDLYSDSEVLAEVNNSKDEVLAELVSNSDSYVQKSESISFAVGEKEKALSSTCLGIVRVESTPDGASYPYQHPVDDFRNQDGFSANVELKGLYIRVGEDNTKIYLGRRFTDEPLSVTVYYITDVADVVSANSIIFGPPIVCSLIITKTTNMLLASRNRMNSVFLRQEEKQTELLDNVISKLNRTSPRYVHYVKD